VDAKLTEEMLKERQDNLNALEVIVVNCQHIGNDMLANVVEQEKKVGIDFKKKWSLKILHQQKKMW